MRASLPGGGRMSVDEMETDEAFWHEMCIRDRVYIANDIAYVVARNGDTFKDLGKEFDISWKKLVKYNDLQLSLIHI